MTRINGDFKIMCAFAVFGMLSTAALGSLSGLPGAGASAPHATFVEAGTAFAG